MMQNFNAEKFGRRAFTVAALFGASYLSSCAPEEPDPGFGVEVMHGDLGRFGSVDAFGDPHGGGGAFTYKGEEYAFTVNRRNPGQENATIHFSDVNVVTDETQTEFGGFTESKRTVRTFNNKPYTITVTFTENSTPDENYGVKQIVLKAGQSSRLGNQYHTQAEAEERMNDRELLKRDMRQMMTDYNNFKDQGHLPVRVILRKLDGPAL